MYDTNSSYTVYNLTVCYPTTFFFQLLFFKQVKFQLKMYGNAYFVISSLYLVICKTYFYVLREKSIGIILILPKKQPNAL